MLSPVLRPAIGRNEPRKRHMTKRITDEPDVARGRDRTSRIDWSQESQPCESPRERRVGKVGLLGGKSRRRHTAFRQLQPSRNLQPSTHLGTLADQGRKSRWAQNLAATCRFPPSIAHPEAWGPTRRGGHRRINRQRSSRRNAKLRRCVRCSRRSGPRWRTKRLQSCRGGHKICTRWPKCLFPEGQCLFPRVSARRLASDQRGNALRDNSLSEGPANGDHLSVAGRVTECHGSVILVPKRLGKLCRCLCAI